MNAQAVTTSILLAADLRTERRIDVTHLNAGIMAASKQNLLEGTIRKRREHPLPARTRIRELSFLLGKIKPLDRERFPGSNGIRDDVLYALRDCRRGLVSRRLRERQRHVQCVDDVPKSVGLRNRNEADVEIDPDAPRGESRLHGHLDGLRITPLLPSIFWRVSI